MCGKKRWDKIRNCNIVEVVEVAPIVNIVENRFRFGHVERNPVDSIVRRVDQTEESYYKRYKKT